MKYMRKESTFNKKAIQTHVIRTTKFKNACSLTQLWFFLSSKIYSNMSE